MTDLDTLLEIPPFLVPGSPENIEAKEKGAKALASKPRHKPPARRLPPITVPDHKRQKGTGIVGITESDLYILKSLGWTEKVLAKLSKRDRDALLAKPRKMQPVDEVAR